jgi:hypothetical protein
MGKTIPALGQAKANPGPAVPQPKYSPHDTRSTIVQPKPAVDKHQK